MLGLQPRRTFFFDPDYESREATLLVSCRQNDAPGILPASVRDRLSLTRKEKLWCKVCLGEGNGNPLQYSCLENPMGRGAW